MDLIYSLLQNKTKQEAFCLCDFRTLNFSFKRVYSTRYRITSWLFEKQKRVNYIYIYKKPRGFTRSPKSYDAENKTLSSFIPKKIADLLKLHPRLKAIV